MRMSKEAIEAAILRAEQTLCDPENPAVKICRMWCGDIAYTTCLEFEYYLGPVDALWEIKKTPTPWGGWWSRIYTNKRLGITYVKAYRGMASSSLKPGEGFIFVGFPRVSQEHKDALALYVARPIHR